MCENARFLSIHYIWSPSKSQDLLNMPYYGRAYSFQPLCLYHKEWPFWGSFIIIHVREEFFCRQRGGDQYFSHSQGGDEYFFTHAKGGTRKNWRPAITNRRSPPSPKKMIAPLLIRNYSKFFLSLRLNWCYIETSLEKISVVYLMEKKWPWKKEMIRHNICQMWTLWSSCYNDVCSLCEMFTASV